ncbi:MAG: hypothetical protein ACT4OM_01065 [Actinomycetota bacterium]
MIPKFLGTGINDVPESQRPAARAALDLATLGCHENPLERIYVRGIRVTEVRPASVLMQSYSWFGIPVTKILVEEGSTICGI